VVIPQRKRKIKHHNKHHLKHLQAAHLNHPEDQSREKAGKNPEVGRAGRKGRSRNTPGVARKSRRENVQDAKLEINSYMDIWHVNMCRRNNTD